MCSAPRVCTTTSICTRSTESEVNARWCCTSSMLAPSRASSAATSASAPGTSRTSTPQAREPARLDHAALDDLGQHQRLDVAAAEHEADLAAGEAPRVSFISAARPTAPAPSTTVFSISSSIRIACSMSSSETRTTSSTSVADHRQGQRAGRLDADAVGDRRLAALAVLAVLGVPGRREALGLHADDADAGPERPGRGGHAGDQAAAADRAPPACRSPAAAPASRARPCPGRRSRRGRRRDGRRSRPRSRGELEAEDAGVVEGVAASTTSAPKLRVFSTFTARGEARHDDGRGDAHALRRGTPRAWAWLPAETASTPRGALGGASAAPSC